MIKIFEESYQFNGGLIIPSNWFYVRRNYRNSIKLLINYYRTRAYNVKSNHLLANILYHVTPDISRYDDIRYKELASSRAEYVARSFELSTPYNYGKVHRGVFFSKHDDEILLFDNKDFDHNYVKSNWMYISPVRILKHPCSNLDLMLPNGKDTNSEHGLCVLKINIALLSFIYRCFYLSDISENKSFARFIHSYILPNMLFDVIDHAMFNRLMKLYYNIPTGTSNTRHALTFAKYDDNLDAILKVLIKDIQSRVERYEIILKNIPCFGRKNSQELMLVGKYIPTMQQDWLYSISRLEVLKFLIDICGERGRKTNQATIMEYSRDMIYMINDKNDKIKNMNSDIKNQIDLWTKEIISYYNK